MGKPAARITDLHTCPVPTHVGGPVLTGVPTVLIGGLPATNLGSTCLCAGLPDVIGQGSFTVLIGGRPAARMGDMTLHGGRIMSGLPTVLIGDGAGSLSADLTQQAAAGLDADAAQLLAQQGAMRRAAGAGSLGCEECR